MNFSELRLKTGLLGFSPRDLNAIFDDLQGQAAEVLTGHRPVPPRMSEIVAVWWEEVITAVQNTVDDAAGQNRADSGYVCILRRYAQHSLLPRQVGAHASSIQAWDYHMGLIIKALDAASIPYEILTIQE